MSIDPLVFAPYGVGTLTAWDGAEWAIVFFPIIIRDFHGEHLLCEGELFDGQYAGEDYFVAFRSWAEAQACVKTCYQNVYGALPQVI